LIIQNLVRVNLEAKIVMIRVSANR